MKFIAKSNYTALTDNQKRVKALNHFPDVKKMVYKEMR